MPTLKLTKRAVDAAKPAARVFYLWDSDVKGFGLKVTPKGHRAYYVKYRQRGSRRPHWYCIGKHGSPWTPDMARREALAVLGEVAAGGHPAADKQRGRDDMTVAELCDLYLAEGCATKKASTLYVDRSRVRRHIKPLLGSHKIGDLARADVERFMRDVAEGKTATVETTRKRGKAVVTGGQGAARKAVTLLGAIFAFAVERGLRADNPAHGVRRYKERPKERYLTRPELVRLGEVLAAAERDGTNPSAINAIRLLALTGCRKGEILTLQWAHVDWQRSQLVLPDSKTGAKVVQIGAPALELLRELPRVDGNPYVLPGAKVGDHFKGLQKVWDALRPLAGLQDVRLHDLRHSFASVGAANGGSLLMIGKVLGHRHAATTARYAHLSDDPVRSFADQTSATVAAALNPPPAAD